MKARRRELVLDLLVLAGAASLARGAFQFSEALGYVVLGAMAIGLGVLGLTRESPRGGE